MSFGVDSFTEASNTILSSHAPDTGTAWAKQSGSDVYVWGANDVAWCILGAAGYYYLTDTPPSADYDVQADVYQRADTGFAGVAARMSSSATKTMYFVWYNSSGNAWQLYSWKAGSLSSVLGSYAESLSNGDTRTVLLTARDNGANVDLEVFIDAVSRITYTDSSSPITAAGYAGIVLAGTADGNCLNLDNFVATDAGGGGGVAIYMHNLLGVGS